MNTRLNQILLALITWIGGACNESPETAENPDQEQPTKASASIEPDAGPGDWCVEHAVPAG